jgi:endonuclease/exonuclease/phosphatase family metal-dependent hydrolase
MDQNGYLKVVSYNVQCLSYGKEREKIVKILKELDADVIGLQELDINTRRSGEGNQLQKLAEELGYEYCYAKTIFHQGGAYGHGVMSKYPIRKSEVVYFDEKVPGTEDRAYSRQVISVDGLKFTLYNVHITGGYGRIYEPLAEVNQVGKRMLKDPCALLTGDFNLAPDMVEAGLPKADFTLLNNKENPKITTVDFNYPIDNIVIRGPLEYRPFENGDAIEVYGETGSDHYPVVAYVKFAEGYDSKY